MPLRSLLSPLFISAILALGQIPPSQAAQPKQAEKEVVKPLSAASQLHALVQLKVPVQVVQALLNTPSIDINAVDDKDKTALDYAQKGSAVYQELVARGAKTSQQLLQLSSASDQDDEKEAYPAAQDAAASLSSDPIPLLSAHYRAHDTLPPLLNDPKQKIQDCYVRLALTTQAAHKQKIKKAKRNPQEEEKQPEKADDKERSWNQSLDYQQLYQVTRPILLEDLWKRKLPGIEQKKEEEEPQESAPTDPVRHITITGEAGTGKTTLTQRITHSWADDRLWNDPFDWVLAIPLRRLGMDTQNPWEKVAKATGIAHLKPAHLRALFTQQADRGLLILDGYDEVQAIYEGNPQSPFSQWLKSCLNNPNLHIILTSRPVELPSSLSKPRQLQVIGFQKTDIDRYVKGYFKACQKADHIQPFLHVLQQEPHLKLLSHTPIYLRLFCMLARGEGPQAIAQKSLNVLYKGLIAQFLQYAWEREIGKWLNAQEAWQQSQMDLTYLSALAWEGMQESCTILDKAKQKKALDVVYKAFPRDDLDEIPHWQRISRLGLLQNIDRTKKGPKEATYFPHLTFQEWFAAYYLSQNFYTKDQESKHVVRDKKYIPRYQVMLPFMAAMLYEKAKDKDEDPDGRGLLLFWKLLESAPRELSGIHHTVLVMRCLEACQADDHSLKLAAKVKKCHNNLIEESARWLAAFLGQSHSDEYNTTLLLARPLQEGLRSCPHLLKHDIVTSTLSSCFLSWKNKAPQKGKKAKDYWRAQYRKLDALSTAPLDGKNRKNIQRIVEHTLEYSCVRANVFGWLNKTLSIPGNWLTQQPAWLLPLLKQGLQDKDEDVRAAACEALGELAAHNDSKDLLPLLKEWLKDQEKDVHRASCWALGKLALHASPEDLLPLLKEWILDEKSFDLPAAACWALRNFASHASPKDLLPLLKEWILDKEYYVRKDAPKAFRKQFLFLLGKGFKKCLVREAAFKALCEFAPHADPKELLPLLKQGLLDKDKDVSNNACEALVKLVGHASPKELLHLLKELIHDTESYVRKNACEALGKLVGHASPNDLLDLLKLGIEDKEKTIFGNYPVREAAYKVLENLAVHASTKELLPLLKKGLQDKAGVVRFHACEALGKLPFHTVPKDKDLLALLKQGIEDEYYDVRAAAYLALKKLEPCTELPLLKKRPQDKIIVASVNICVSLHPLIGRWPQDKEIYVRKGFCGAPLLDKGLLGENYNVHWNACGILEVPGVHTEGAKFLSLPEKGLLDENYNVHCTACGILEAPGAHTEAAKFLPLLEKGLLDKDFYLREAACNVLGTHADAAKLLPFLAKWLQDEYYNVRMAANKALTAWSLARWQQASQKLLKVTTQDEKTIQFLAQCLLRYSAPVLLPPKTKVLKRYQKFYRALNEQAKEWGFPTNAYQTKQVEINVNEAMPELTMSAEIKHYLTPLHQAARKGNLQEMEKRYQESPCHLHQRNNDNKRTPLLEALAHGRWEAAAWCIKKGAWIDMADREPITKTVEKRTTVLEYYIEALFAGNKSVIAEGLKKLLVRRTRFPKERLQESLAYLKRKLKNYNIGDTQYRKEMIQSISILLGRSPQDIEYILEKCADDYRAYCKNIEEEVREGEVRKKFKKGREPLDILPIRICILFELWYKLRAGNLVSLPDSGADADILDVKELTTHKLQRELITELTTYWDHRTMLALEAKRLKDYFTHWGTGIIQRLPTLASAQELCLVAGDRGHCVYIALRKEEDYYSVRIDNQYLDSRTVKRHEVRQNQQKQKFVRSALIAYFEEEEFANHQDWLTSYIAKAMKKSNSSSHVAMGHLYQTDSSARPPCSDLFSREAIEKPWPFLAQQTTAQNCVMRSHNPGLAIRMGESMYEWFRKKEVSSEVVHAYCKKPSHAVFMQ